MNETKTIITFQDPIKLSAEIKTSLGILHRGSQFNVLLSMQNVLKKPIKIVGHSWQLPPGFSFISESPGNKNVEELQPGDSCSLVYTLKAYGLLSIFKRQKPAQTGNHLISLNLFFLIDDREHAQEIQTTFNIHASPREIYISSIISAILGSFVKNPSLGFEHLVSGILGLFIVLVAKRRTEVQLGISIEDWVGGAVVGFCVGYLGSSYLEQFLPQKTV